MRSLMRGQVYFQPPTFNLGHVPESASNGVRVTGSVQPDPFSDSFSVEHLMAFMEVPALPAVPAGAVVAMQHRVCICPHCDH